MRRLMTIAITALLCAAVVASAQLTDRSSAPSLTSTRNSVKRVVGLNGHITGLYPGNEAILRVRSHNRTTEPVRLMRVRAKVRKANAACGKEYLKIRRAEPKRVIPPHRRIEVRMKVRLSPLAPDACQGARWPVRFRARAVTLTGERP